MKKIFVSSIMVLAVSVTTIVSCSKVNPGRTDNLPALNPAKTDVDAGAWKTILLTGPTEFSVGTPAAITTPGYVAELNEIKALQNNISAEQQTKISYWGAGGVLRWNELMRELVAKYNLPPYQNADGTYPIPSAANPFAYPLFPFTNPPYSARAYAYISGAQYDALVAAWYYKKLYNRPAPYKTDIAIKAKLTPSELGSYPSESAVLAGVTAEMMKLLFPGEIAYIQQKLEEQELATIMAGAATRSDIEAGEALGRLVAQKFTARARTDKAGAAVGTPADWAQMEKDVTSKGEVAWISQDAPKRPPMLPLFGKVSPFLFDANTTIALRPPPPPLTGSDQFKKETAEVLDMVTNQTRERLRIVHFWADGVGTYTPPGHWNAIAAEDFIGKNFSEVRWARNLALLNMSMMDAAIVCWDTKTFYCNPRPSQMNPAIKTLTGLPNFPSFISGHSTFSGAAATILGYIVPEKASAYQAMATEASLSRMYGGIHYRSDCEVGLSTGKKIGDYAVTRAKADGADQ
ncbi:MAG: phosphatase family protein [Sediminibacterium sp.]|nr:phosphatase family protein [Sediminibacterium sp.]